MTTDPRGALARLIAALEHHFDVARAVGEGDDRALIAAEEMLADAFFTYDDELFTTYGVELPFDILDEDDEDLDDDEEDDPDIFDIDAD
ncbi:MAG: DNA primase [Actinomycetaceae bacterium]|nr:DNA primase [Actinomycetaceae bacterium]